MALSQRAAAYAAIICLILVISVRRMTTKQASASWSVRCLAQTPARIISALRVICPVVDDGLPQRVRLPRLPKRQAQMANAGPAKIELTFADLQAEMPL